MKRMTLIACLLSATLLLAPLNVAFAEDPTNLGQLTSYSIQDLGFDQGAHASDPSGDGNGPEVRVGLANIVERGNLRATFELLLFLLGF